MGSSLAMTEGDVTDEYEDVGNDDEQVDDKHIPHIHIDDTPPISPSEEELHRTTR